MASWETPLAGIRCRVPKFQSDPPSTGATVAARRGLLSTGMLRFADRHVNAEHGGGTATLQNSPAQVGEIPTYHGNVVQSSCNWGCGSCMQNTGLRGGKPCSHRLFMDSGSPMRPIPWRWLLTVDRIDDLVEATRRAPWAKCPCRSGIQSKSLPGRIIAPTIVQRLLSTCSRCGRLHGRVAFV